MAGRPRIDPGGGSSRNSASRSAQRRARDCACQRSGRRAFINWAKKHFVKLLYTQPGKPNQNAFIERFNRRFREEVLNAWLFNDVSEVQAAADRWLADYYEFRPHDSLGSVPPAVPFDHAAFGRKRLAPLTG